LSSKNFSSFLCSKFVINTIVLFTLNRGMEMNFKLKTLVAVLALSAAAATSANAATVATGGNSSVIFSAWDAVNLQSYSIDLGKVLNDFIGVDTVGTYTKATVTLDNNNALTAQTSAYSGVVAADGTIFDKALTNFSLTSGVWNLAAADGAGRNRILFSDSSVYAGNLNSEIGNVAGSVTSYIGLGAAASKTAGTVGTDTDAFYADSATWGDTFGASGITGSSNALGGVSDIYVAWQQSTALTDSAAGFANLTAGGKNVFATTYLAADGLTHFKLAVAVAAVPEADTSGMMLAGLGLMGFIARRRNRKQA
jgi:hypothetical protein